MSLHTGTTYNLILSSAGDLNDDKIVCVKPISSELSVADDTDSVIEFDDQNEPQPDGIAIESLILNKATWGSAYINLTSTVIGAGVLGLPHAFASTGFLGGAILLLICASSSAFALHFLAKCAKRIPPPVSFYCVAEVALPGYSFWIDLAVAIKCYGVATSYLVVIGDLMPAGKLEASALTIAAMQMMQLFLHYFGITLLPILQ